MLGFELGVFVGTNVTVVIGYLVLSRYFTVALKHKYVFECPSEGCEFAISSNSNPDLVKGMGQDHLNSAHFGGRST